MADHQGEAGDLRRDAAGECTPSRRPDGVLQSDAGRRLDGDGPARDDRRRGPVRPSRGRSASARKDARHECRTQESKLARQEEAASSSIAPRELDEAIARARRALLDVQRPDGHFVFELEADCTIPAEYILLPPFSRRPADAGLEAKIGAYLRRHQTARMDGWPLFAEGAFDISCSVKAYFALKMIGDSPDAPHMRRARAAILKRWRRGAAPMSSPARCSRFTAKCPGAACRSMPVEIMHLPRWFPFHLSKISYWGRTVLAPLLVRPRAEAEGRQSARRRASRSCSSSRAERGPALAGRAASETALDGDLRRDRSCAALERALFSRALAQERHRQGASPS